jgi:hypothetical protein
MNACVCIIYIYIHVYVLLLPGVQVGAEHTHEFSILYFNITQHWPFCHTEAFR